MRELTGKEFGISPLQAEELWRTTRSRHALEVLRRYAKGYFTFNNSNKFH
jgi:hypothetical protein